MENMIEAVHCYEGTVNQVMGDVIMALLGAPLAHEDHVVRACHAALRMQESGKRHAEEVFRRDGLPVEIRMSLNSGEEETQGIPPTNVQLKLPVMHLDRVINGKIVEHRGLANEVDFMRQLGVVLAPKQGGS